MRRSISTQSVGQMRLDQADLARDAKKEEAMCASALCTASHGLKKAPDGYRGRYGGRHLCQKHYEQVVDYIRDNGCLPSEGSNKPTSMDDFFDE